jgi:hypothetical protein
LKKLDWKKNAVVKAKICKFSKKKKKTFFRENFVLNTKISFFKKRKTEKNSLADLRLNKYRSEAS